MKTRPDTRQDSRGQLGRGRNAIIAWNSKKFVTDIARCRVACSRLKIKYDFLDFVGILNHMFMCPTVSFRDVYNGGVGINLL